MRAAGLLYSVAATAAGLAIQMCDGEYRPNPQGDRAIFLVTFAIAAAALAVAGPFRLTQLIVPRPIFIGVFTGLLGIQFAYLLTNRPDSQERSYLLGDIAGTLRLYVPILCTGALAAGAVLMFLWRAPRPRLLALSFAALLVAFAAAAVLCLKTTHRRWDDSTPHIDVFVFQQEAARVLLHGKDPYRIANYPDIYHSALVDPATGRLPQQVYAPGLSDGQVLRFGFPYLPASLYLTTLGYAVNGDYRYVLVAALLASGVFLFRIRPDAVGALSAALLLFTPRCFFVLISGWTEPLLVMWMAAVLFCAARQPRWLPVALGLLLATKQYMVLALPLTYLLVPRDAEAFWPRWLKLLGGAACVALMITLPLALWDWQRFYFSAFAVQRDAPFRWDALSYLTWHYFGQFPPSERLRVVWPLGATAVATALCFWRARPSPAQFAGATALVFLVFIAFNKQAFANYYFFVIGALCCAAAPDDTFRRVASEPSLVPTVTA